MLELRPLETRQYRQVAEWEWGPQGDDTDWAGYEREMSSPQWRHMGIYDGAAFVGCVSFEQINPHTMAYHVVTARRTVKPYSLAQVLLKSAQFFFDRGFTRLAVRIPAKNRAAARLALRCGMKEEDATATERNFILIKSRYLKYGKLEA